MKEIAYENLTGKAKKEIDRFFKIDRFPTNVLAQKKGNGFKLLFVERDNMELFNRQNKIDDYMRVVDF